MYHIAKAQQNHVLSKMEIQLSILFSIINYVHLDFLANYELIKRMLDIYVNRLIFLFVIIVFVYFVGVSACVHFIYTHTHIQTINYS